MGAKKVERPVEPCFLNAAPRLYADLTWVLWILWTGPVSRSDDVVVGGAISTGRGGGSSGPVPRGLNLRQRAAGMT